MRSQHCYAYIPPHTPCIPTMSRALTSRLYTLVLIDLHLNLKTLSVRIRSSVGIKRKFQKEEE